MNSKRFSLPSEHLELLLAFEEHKGLTKLAEFWGRDPSVISRGLQRIAEDFPVLVKVKGKWELTPLGRQVNEQTRVFMTTLQSLLPASDAGRDIEKRITPSARSVLLILNAQVALQDATQEGRNNSRAEENIENLLAQWRRHQRPVVHVRHVSESPHSIFYRNSEGSQILPALRPVGNEPVLEKDKASAFSNSALQVLLDQINAESLFIVGFTANECIDATAKDSSSLGFVSYVVGDATAVFDMRGPDGKLIKAERLHKLTLANIHAYSATVIRTQDI